MKRILVNNDETLITGDLRYIQGIMSSSPKTWRQGGGGIEVEKGPSLEVWLSTVINDIRR